MQIKYIALLFNYYFIIFLEKRYISPKEKLHSRKKHKLREFSKYPLLLTPPFSIARREGESLPPGFSPSVFTTPPSPGGYPPSPQKTPLSQNPILVISQKPSLKKIMNSSSRTNRAFTQFLGQAYAK